MSAPAPNSAHYYVVDAVGDTYLHMFAGLDYEPRFRAHVRWWVRHRTRPGAWRDTDSHGNQIPNPIKPTRVVIEPYHDPSQPAQ